MARTGRRPRAAVTPGSALARLIKTPQRFQFDAGVRLLMHAAGTSDPAVAVRFRSVPGLGFPGADIATLRPAENGRPAQMATPIMGLTGTTGVLPRYYTEVLGQTLRDRSRAMHDFVDMLSHRMVAQFASAGVKYRLARAVETARLRQPDATRTDEDAPRAVAARSDTLPPDPVASILLSLTGYGTGHLRGRLAAGTDPLLHYAGLLTMRPRSADRLAALVSDWLGRPVEVVQFAGAWLPLGPDQQSTMPLGRRPGQFNRLGVDVTIGTRAWDVQARVILRVGPLDRAAFSALLPDRPALRRLVSLVRAFLGFETGFAINPVLSAKAVPPAVLGGADAPQLGWNSWLPSPGLGRRGDLGEAVFEAETVEAGEAR